MYLRTTRLNITFCQRLLKLLQLNIFLLCLTFCTSSYLLAQTQEQNQIQEKKFEQWLHTIKSQALKKGIRKLTLNQAFKDVHYNQTVVQRDQTQLPATETDYLSWIKNFMHNEANFLKASRIQMGKKLIKEHAILLAKIEKEYHIPKEVIVALWGVESFYGHQQGTYSVISALATLAFEGRRAKFFTDQLFSALQILDQEHITVEKMLGSWAGAMGHCQFMPSNFFAYAVDYDKDGKRDIWNSIPDALASIANYLKKVKWKKNKPIGQLTFEKPKVQTTAKTKTQTKTKSNQKSPKKLSIITLPLKEAPFLIAKDNYNTILRWNRSALFAAKIIYLSEQLKN